ncbi:hypothetical protein ACWGOQ_0011145 [Aquimarina sp. M1]
MNILRNKYRKLWDRFLDLRTLFSAATYGILLFAIVSRTEPDTTAWLYLEVYNVTLFYLIINMILFAKDILKPKSNLIFSKESMEVILVLIFSAVLITSLYLSKEKIHAFETSSIIIKINATFVMVTSVIMCTRRKASSTLNEQ